MDKIAKNIQRKTICFRFNVPMRSVGMRGMTVRDECRIRIAAKVNLDVKNFAELAKMLQQLRQIAVLARELMNIENRNEKTGHANRHNGLKSFTRRKDVPS